MGDLALILNLSLLIDLKYSISIEYLEYWLFRATTLYSKAVLPLTKLMMKFLVESRIPTFSDNTIIILFYERTFVTDYAFKVGVMRRRQKFYWHSQFLYI